MKEIKRNCKNCVCKIDGVCHSLTCHGTLTPKKAEAEAAQKMLLLAIGTVGNAIRNKLTLEEVYEKLKNI